MAVADSIEISRLQNSISHLQRTQEELRTFIAEELEADDDGELGRAVDENDMTMSVVSDRSSLQLELTTQSKSTGTNSVDQGGAVEQGWRRWNEAYGLRRHTSDDLK